MYKYIQCNYRQCGSVLFLMNNKYGYNKMRNVLCVEFILHSEVHWEQC